MQPLIAITLALQLAHPAKPATAPKPSTPSQPQRSFNVSVVPSQQVSRFNPGGSFVIGSDGVARTCPNDKNVGMFVRAETTPFQNVFINVPNTGSMLMSSPTRAFTIACLKIE